jgi:hypothetical protein
MPQHARLLFVARQRYHLLPVYEVAAQMVHHLHCAETLERVDVSFFYLWLFLHRFAVGQLRRGLHSWRSRLLAGHFDLPLSNVVLHSTSGSPYVIPREFL